MFIIPQFFPLSTEFVSKNAVASSWLYFARGSDFKKTRLLLSKRGFDFLLQPSIFIKDLIPILAEFILFHF